MYSVCNGRPAQQRVTTRARPWPNGWLSAVPFYGIAQW
jgi:hypothetical protein